MTAPRLALSTMYQQRWLDEHDLAPFVQAALAMGFDGIELSHILSVDTVRSLDPGSVRVDAVHHPCPNELDPGTGSGGIPTLVARGKRERSRAQVGIRRSIDTAVAFGARAVVLHLGHLEDDDRGTCRRLRFELASRYAAGQRATAHYDDVRRRLLDWVRSAEPSHLERAMVPLAELVDYSGDRGVTLSLETGYLTHELPLSDGMARLLENLRSLGAWLDTGHVGTQENLGLASFDDWFQAVGTRWTGAHFHDVVGLRDHLAPGMGTLDFEAIASRIDPSAVTTLEVDWYFDEAEVAAGGQLLRRCLSAAWER